MEPIGQPQTGPAVLDSEPLPHRRIVFAIVSIALLMASIDQTIVATALNAIQHDLHAQLNWSGWTITIYALGQIIVMPLAGRLGDQFGRKRIFLGAAVVFTIASLCCSLAGNIYLLVIFRAFQAIGGGGRCGPEGPAGSGIRGHEPDITLLAGRQLTRRGADYRADRVRSPHG